MLSMLRAALYQKSKDRAHILISSGEQIKEDESYVVIKIKSARIMNVRKGWSKFYPCIYSYVRLVHEREGEREVSSIVRPSKLGELDAANVDKVIVHDHTILDAVAYRGGALEIELGVCAVKSSNLAAPYLQLLDEISAASGVAVLEAARPFSGIVGKGVELLLGSGEDVALEVGLHAELEAVESVRAILDETKAAAEARKFRVDDSDGTLLLDDGSPYTSSSYCVYEICQTRKKHNWRSIPLVSNSFDRINDALEQNRINDAEEELKTFNRLCLISADLVPKDARRLIQRISSKFEEVEQIGLAAEEVKKPLGSLDDIDIYETN